MQKAKLTTLLICSFVILFLLSLPYYSGDIKNHLVWAQSILNQGFLGFYERDFPGFAFPNYPPVAMFLFALSLALYNFINNIVIFLNNNLGIFPSNFVYLLEWENSKIAFLKLPAILSNVFITFAIYLLYPYFSKKKSLKFRLIIPVIFLFNPATIYLSSLWGQTDLLPVMFFLYAIIFLVKNKFYLSVFFITLSILSKQTIIIFLPFYFFFLFKQFGLKNVIKSLFIITTLFYLSYLPFHGPSATWSLELYKLNFDLVAHSTSENAFNLWGVLFHLERHSDQEIFLGITLQTWGYIIFTSMTTFPLILYIRKYDHLILFFKIMILVTLIYFFSLTRMHERYLIPVVVFLTLLSMYDRKYLLSLVYISFFHFINLYRGLLQPDNTFLNYIITSYNFLVFLVIGYFLVILHNLYLFIKNDH